MTHNLSGALARYGLILYHRHVASFFRVGKVEAISLYNTKLFLKNQNTNFPETEIHIPRGLGV